MSLRISRKCPSERRRGKQSKASGQGPREHSVLKEQQVAITRQWGGRGRVTSSARKDRM